jgi:aromatic-L-amino-acid/L-tryptophan decarboxylase
VVLVVAKHGGRQTVTTAPIPDDAVPHMTTTEFRKYGYRVIDWIATYYDQIESYPVLSQATPGQVRGGLAAHAPADGDPVEAILADLDRVILPGVTHWQHPSFFAYFPANASFPAILAELVSAGLGLQGMLWSTSPACTEVETLALDWLAELLGLPPRFSSSSRGGGVLQDSASSATLVALLAALHRASGGTAGHAGVGQQPYTVYASTQAHSSLAKAVRIAGLGSHQLRLLEADPATQALRVDHLQRVLAADLAQGAVPTMVMAAVGTTSTGAVDPLRQLGQVCGQHGIWLHVDAAYAGVAAVCPEFGWLNDGVELADSYCTNPHKWLLTNFDCDAFWVADRQALVQALGVLPEYLRNPASDTGGVLDYRDWQIPLGRRFRALKLWWVLRWYGRAGLQAHIRRHVALAREVAAWVGADDRFELVAPPSLGLVCFRQRADDATNQRLLARLNASGQLYLTHTRVNGRYVLRLAIGGTLTQARHVRAAWQQISAQANHAQANH